MDERRKSQKEAILEYLQTHDGISAIEALNLCGCFRLAAIIFILRDEGWNIDKLWKGEGHKRYAWYFLKKEEVA